MKSRFNHSGPAWIGRVRLSRYTTTVYFNGRALKRAKGGGISGNHFDIESGEEYWVSGIKRNGEDRHWASSGRILIEAAAVEEYLALRNLQVLHSTYYEITESIVQTDIAKFRKIENQSNWKLHDEGV